MAPEGYLICSRLGPDKQDADWKRPGRSWRSGRLTQLDKLYT